MVRPSSTNEIVVWHDSSVLTMARMPDRENATDVTRSSAHSPRKEAGGMRQSRYGTAEEAVPSASSTAEEMSSHACGPR